MRKLIPLKFFSQLLLMLILIITVNGVHESAHAMQSHVTAVIDRASPSDFSASHQCPCSPLEQHKDSDGCDTCVNCTCHAPLTIQPFQISYNPSVLNILFASAPFNFFPEVYLSLFVPPDSTAV
jgi:hypothetical protein